MGIFDDDPFEDIFAEFFGNSQGRAKRRKNNFIEGEGEDRVIDFIEDDNKIYLIFELFGYSEKDVSVSVSGKEIEIRARKKNGEMVQNYLMEKLHGGFLVRKTLPSFVDPKNFSYTMKNGILEVVF